jgi:hypothetical protein
MKKYFFKRTDNLNLIISFLSVSTFFIFTPLYLYFSGVSKINNFLDGNYYLLQLTFLLILLLNYRPGKINTLEIIWIIVFLYFTIYLLYDLFFNEKENIKDFHNLILTSALYYLIGKNICQINLSKIFYLALMLLALNFNINDGRIDFYGAIEANRYGTYLEISHKFMIGILLINFSLKKENYISILLVPILMMIFSFLIGARSDLIISIIILFIIIFLNRKIINNNYGIFLLFLLFFYFVINANSRFSNIFNLINDESFIGRMQLFSNGLEQIYENPFLGDYKIKGEKHIHNYLFYWQKYGLIPFILINIIVLYIWKYKVEILGIENNYKYSYSIISIYIILSILLFKDGYFEYISLLCGLAGNKFLKKNE